MSYKTMAQRFWEKVDKDGPIPEHVPELGKCWHWNANMFANGYGQFSVNPKVSTQSTCAHRVAWELTNGEITNGLFVLHKCDNRKCVNPSHLFLGTHLDNMKDAFIKGRHAMGIRQGLAKLDDSKIVEIRKMHSDGISQADIARYFHITIGNINFIVHRKTWKHVK